MLSAVMGLLDGRARDPRGRRHGQRRQGRRRRLRRPAERVHRLAAGPAVDDPGRRAASSSPTPYDENRIIVPLKQIAPIMQKAQIAIEDSRFYEHGGVDVRGFSRALVSNAQGGDVQGASTLTQQYVKLTLQENALRRRRGGRARPPSPRAYVPQAPGAEVRGHAREEDDQGPDPRRATSTSPTTATRPTASRRPRSTTSASAPAKLNLAQAALLAGLVQQPTAYNPVTTPRSSQARRNVVLDRMQELGVTTAKDVKAAKKVTVKKMLKATQAAQGHLPALDASRTSAPTSWSTSRSRRRWPSLGKTPAERLKNINQGGLTIQTTLDPELQKADAASELDQGRADRQQEQPRGGGRPSSSPHRQDPRDGPDHRLRQGRRPTSTSTRSTAAASSASSSARRPRCSRLVTALEKGMPSTARSRPRSADAKKALRLQRTRRSARPSAAPTSRGRSRTTTPAAARHDAGRGAPPSRSTPRSPQLVIDARAVQRARHDDQDGPAPGRRQADRPVPSPTSPSAPGTTPR